MRSIGLLLFILAIPVLAALGHDAYLTYHDQDFTKTMMFSNLGYLWTHYSPDTYVWARKNIDTPVWEGYIVPVLRCYTALAATAPAAFTAAILLLLKLFNLPPYRNDVSVARGHKRGRFGFKDAGSQKGRMKYKRK